MDEVSSRIFAFYSEVASQYGAPAEQLAAGLPSVQRVLRGARWYDWADHVRLLERFQELVGGPGQAERLALESSERTVAAPLRALACRVAEPRLLYRAGFRWFGASLYRHVRIDYEELGRSELFVAIAIPRPYAGSECFFRMWRGTLRGMPRMLNLPDATVVAEFDDREGRFRVLPPEGRDVLSRLRRVMSHARASASLIAHLERHEQELRNAYEALLRSRQDFREIARHTPDAVMLVRGAAVVYQNPAASALLSGRSLLDAVQPDERGRLRRCLEEAERRGHSASCEFRIGEVHLEANAAHAIDFEGEAAVLLVARDISSRRAAEQRLKESERSKQALLEAVPDLILRISSEGLIAEVTGKISHPLASHLRARVGQPLRALSGELSDLPDDLAQRLLSGAAASSPDVFVLETPARIGRERLHLEWRGVMTDAKDLVCLVRDLSRQKRLEAELRATERLASMGMLAAGVGHEVNTPLSYVLMHLKLLEKALSDNRPKAELLEHLAASREGAEHIQRVVSSLRAMAQPATPHRHPVDVNQVLDAMVRLVQSQFPPNTRLEKDYQPRLYALADEGPLGQVFTNLLMNAAQAVEATGRGGEIRLVTRPKGDVVEIEIRDTGVGMTPEVAARVLDPFFTTKLGSGGSGLGLALAQRIVSALGGLIELESTLNEGTVFRVTLPLAEPPPEVTSAPSPMRSLEGTRVLVVDDQPNIISTLRLMLNDCRVLGAASAVEALDSLRREQVDVVLCDMVMPDLDGIAFYERVKELAPELVPKVVFMTGGAVRPDIEVFLERVPNVCLQKPFTEERLRAALFEARQKGDRPESALAG